MKTSKPLIFVVDDNEYTLLQVKRSIENAFPCEVHTFSKGADALHKIYLNPDFVLSDYNLNGNGEDGINGEQLLILLKQNRPDIPVMMYSSRNSVALAVRLMKRGASDFVNSDTFSNTGNFALRLARMVKLEKERMHRRSLEKQIVMVAVVIAAIFVFSLFIVSELKIALLPYVVLGFILLFGGLLFFGSPSLISQFFKKKKTQAATLDD